MAPMGESSTKAILWHINQNNKSNVLDVASRPKLFVDALKKILGLGTPMVEKMIVTQIKSEFDLPGDIKSLEAVKLARAANK